MTEPEVIRLSALQLKHMTFTKVSVEIADATDQTAKYWAPNYDLGGIGIHTTIETAAKEEADPTHFMVTVEFSILNDRPEHRKSPYLVDIKAIGFFEVAKGVPAEKRDAFVRVNGASILIGAIREMVGQVTARSAYGPMTLPTLQVIPPKDDPQDPQASKK